MIFAQKMDLKSGHNLRYWFRFLEKNQNNEYYMDVNFPKFNGCSIENYNVLMKEK